MRSGQFTARAGVVVVVLAVAGVSLWLGPILLTHEPDSGMTAVERHEAMNEARSSIMTFLIALGAGGSLLFTARQYVISREGHVTDRFSRSVEHLGPEHIAVRVGGLYALERIGRDSPRDRTTVLYLVGAFIRQPPPSTTDAVEQPSRLRTDVQTALRVANRLVEGWDGFFDLRGASLRHAQLAEARLEAALFDDCDLRDANLRNARLAGASFCRAILMGADLSGADLRNADLREAQTTNARLDGANLDGARIDKHPQQP